MNNNTVYEWILQSTFTVAARQKSLQSAKPHLFPHVHSNDEVLDLCCIRLWSVLARRAGSERDWRCFRALYDRAGNKKGISPKLPDGVYPGGCFRKDFGSERFDLISCFGISDFPPSALAKLGKKVAYGLKLGSVLCFNTMMEVMSICRV